ASGVVTGNVRLEIFYGTNGEIPYPDAFKDQTVNDYIVFLNARGNAPNGAPIYELADPVSGAFSIRDGKVSYPGIRTYKGLPVEKLEADIQALLSPTTSNKDLPPISLGREGDGLRLQ